jgi:hypothetical protein
MMDGVAARQALQINLGRSFAGDAATNGAGRSEERKRELTIIKLAQQHRRQTGKWLDCPTALITQLGVRGQQRGAPGVYTVQLIEGPFTV